MLTRLFTLASLAVVAASGQSIVSARSGVLHFVEGEVFIGDMPIQQKAGKFPEVKEGAELRTEAGRAEVLLTPGVVLRLGPDSAIRMVSASLIDTRLEFRHGSAIVEISQDPKDTLARVLYRDYEVKFPRHGLFRIDSIPREFRVFEGEAEVSYQGEKRSLTKGHMVSLYGGLMTETIPTSMTDGLDEWSMRRSDKLVAENPPPGDLNGNGYDPVAGMLGTGGISSIPLSTDPFYGLGGYSLPFSPYYGSGYPYYGMGYPYYGYMSPFSAYGSYGFHQPGFYPYNPTHVFNPSSPYRPAPRAPIYHPASPFPGTGYRPPSSVGVGGARPVVGRPAAGAAPHPVGRAR
jgi:hypothetical protein